MGREPTPIPWRPAPMLARFVWSTLVLSIAAALLACTPVVEPSASPADVPLVQITTRGGDCPSAPCVHVVLITRDGLVLERAPRDVQLGVVPEAQLEALDATIRTTDFAALRAVPFTGECPINVDGQELVYEFGAPGGVERLASCESEFDPNDPAFATVREALIASGAF